MPKSHVRLSAGREQMDDSTQALAFLAGANSIFYGERLLTTGNPQANRDRELFERLGLHPETRQEVASDDVREAALKAAMEEQARANVEGSLFYDATREATPASDEGHVRERKPCGLVV